MPKTIDVTTFGAVGDGVADDGAAIGRAVAALASDDTLYFPDRPRGYHIGDLVVQLPADVGLSRVAGIDHVVPPSGSALRICGDSSGIIAHSRGNVFDTGRPFFRFGASVYAGNIIFPKGSPNGLAMFQRPAACSLLTVDPELTNVQRLSDATELNPHEGHLDPHLIELADGSLRVVYQFLAPGLSALQIRTSTDVGQTWGHTQTITPADPTRQSFSEPFALRLDNPERVILCWLDHDKKGMRDTIHRTAFSDDGLVSLSIQTVATPESGRASAGRIIDNSRASMYELADGTLALLYSRKVGTSPAEVWGRRLSRTGVPISDPVLIATVTRVSGDHIQIGVDPIVVRRRDGTFALYFTAMDMSTGHGFFGELHLMLSSDGRPESFQHDRTVILATNVGGGYGRPWPVCLPGGDVAVVMTSAPAGENAYLIVARHYHACG
jgi:hypothetical protein